MKFRRRAAGVLLGAALGLSTLTACGMNASTVAQIGDHTITTEQFDEALADAYADPIVGADLKDQGEAFRTVFLNDLLSYEISKAVAAEAGVTVSEADIDAEFEESLAGQSAEAVQKSLAEQGTPVTLEQMRMRIATQLVNSKFGEVVLGKTQDELAAEKFEELATHRDENPGLYTTFDVTVAGTADQAFADDWVAKVNEQGMTLQEAIDSNPDEDPAASSEVVSQPVNGADFAQSPDFIEQLDAIDVGDTGLVVQGPDQSGAFAYFAVTMDEKTVVSDDDLQEQADYTAQQEFFTAGMKESAAQAKKVEIEVNPRFGTVEYPEQGLPSITTPTPGTFSEPDAAADPTMPPGIPMA